MTESEFKSRMLYAESMKDLDNRPAYWAGYIRGLRRRYHGEDFGTAEDHARWMSLIDDPDETRVERGQGYRDALEEIVIRPMICSRCGYDWMPRTAARPTVCPKCKSPYWDKKKLKKL